MNSPGNLRGSEIRYGNEKVGMLSNVFINTFNLAFLQFGSSLFENKLMRTLLETVLREEDGVQLPSTI